MHNSDARKQLEDAVALLTMLEQLSESCEREPSRGTRLTWRGLRLSIEQSKQLVVRALSGGVQTAERAQNLRSETVREPVRSASGAEPGAVRASAPSSNLAATASSLAGSSLSGSTLAGRITKAPTTRGRVRELGSGADSVPSQGAVRVADSKVHA